MRSISPAPVTRISASATSASSKVRRVPALLCAAPVTRALRSNVIDRPVAAWIAGISPNSTPVPIDARAETATTRQSMVMMWMRG